MAGDSSRFSRCGPIPEAGGQGLQDPGQLWKWAPDHARSSYRNVIQTAAQTLYGPTAGVINSWRLLQPRQNYRHHRQYVYAAQNGGASNWYNMAVIQALKTMQNNVRPDGSTYQRVEYNTDGSVYSQFTADGYSTDSTWSREDFTDSTWPTAIPRTPAFWSRLSSSPTNSSLTFLRTRHSLRMARRSKKPST